MDGADHVTYAAGLRILTACSNVAFPLADDSGLSNEARSAYLFSSASASNIQVGGKDGGVN